MSALTASAIAEQWLYATLSADTTIISLVGANVFSTVAPQGASYPMLVFVSLGGVDVTALGPYRTYAKQRYALKGIGQAGSIAAVLDPLMSRVDVLLFGNGATATHGAVVAATRISQMVLGDPDAGVAYRQVVSVYELLVSETVQ